jgi:hypothetical protein
LLRVTFAGFLTRCWSNGRAARSSEGLTTPALPVRRKWLPS